MHTSLAKTIWKLKLQILTALKSIHKSLLFRKIFWDMKRFMKIFLRKTCQLNISSFFFKFSIRLRMKKMEIGHCPCLVPTPDPIDSFSSVPDMVNSDLSYIKLHKAFYATKLYNRLIKKSYIKIYLMLCNRWRMNFLLFEPNLNIEIIRSAIDKIVLSELYWNSIYIDKLKKKLSYKTTFQNRRNSIGDEKHYWFFWWTADIAIDVILDFRIIY